MFADELLDVLKSNKALDSDGEVSSAVLKINSRKRMSSKEFFKVYDALWKEGPETKYQAPESWNDKLDRAK